MIIYSNVCFLDDNLDLSEFTDDFYLFWVARLGVSALSAPSRSLCAVWDRPWTFWQYVQDTRNKQRDKELVPGIGEKIDVDLDFFAGSMSELNDLVIP